MKADRDKRIIGFVFIMLLAVSGVVYAAIPQNTLRHNAGIVFPTVNATTGYYVGANQIIDATRAGAFVTLDTGQGANELYDMDQNVLTTDSPEFVSLSLTGPFINDWNLTEHFDYPGLPYSYEVGIVPGSNPSIYYTKSGTDGSIYKSGTNASNIIQSALDAVYNGGAGYFGGKIFVKGGTYVLGSQIKIYPKTWLIGEGSIKTRFDVSHTGIGIVVDNDADDIHLKDFELIGNNKTNTRGIYVGSGLGSHSSFENLYIWNHGTDGIYIGSSTSHSSNGFSIINVRSINNGRHGMYLVGQGMSSISFIDSYFNSNNNQGIRWEADGDGNIVEGCVFEANNEYGIYFGTGIHGSQINGCYFDGNTNAGVFVSDCNGLVFSGCRVTNKGADVGIRIFSGYHNSIIGGYFNDYSTGGKHVLIDSLAYYTTIIMGNHAGTGTQIIDQGIGTVIIGGEYQNSGNATLAALSSSITVNHGCSYTPTLGDIQVTPNRALGNCTYYWTDTYTATQFTIHVGAAGAEKNIDKTVYFLWSVRRH